LWSTACREQYEQDPAVLMRCLAAASALLCATRHRTLLWAHEQWALVDERARRETADALAQACGLGIKEPWRLQGSAREIVRPRDDSGMFLWLSVLT
jgi:hypothetical protein